MLCQLPKAYQLPCKFSNHRIFLANIWINRPEYLLFTSPMRGVLQGALEALGLALVHSSQLVLIIEVGRSYCLTDSAFITPSFFLSPKKYFLSPWDRRWARRRVYRDTQGIVTLSRSWNQSRHRPGNKKMMTTWVECFCHVNEWNALMTGKDKPI